jgi:hypothetical protein
MGSAGRQTQSEHAGFFGASAFDSEPRKLIEKPIRILHIDKHKRMPGDWPRQMSQRLKRRAWRDVTTSVLRRAADSLRPCLAAADQKQVESGGQRRGRPTLAISNADVNRQPILHNCLLNDKAACGEENSGFEMLNERVPSVGSLIMQLRLDFCHYLIK